MLTIAALIAVMAGTAQGLTAPPQPLIIDDPQPSVVEPLIIDLDNNVPVDGVALLEFAFPDDPRFNYGDISDVEIFPFKAFLSRVVSVTVANWEKRKEKKRKSELVE